MKKFLLVICAMLLTCVTAVNAQNSTETIMFTGTLTNPTTTVKDYIIRVYKSGKDKQILDEVKAEEDGSFRMAVFSDRAVRFVVLDKKKNVVFTRTFFGSEGNHKMDFNEIDLSKDNTRKTSANQ